VNHVCIYICVSLQPSAQWLAWLANACYQCC